MSLGPALPVSVNSTELYAVEGSTAPLTIGVEGLTEHATVTLTVDEGAITLGDDELSSLELVLDAKTTQRTVSVMADDDDYAPADPAVIALSVMGNIALPPFLSAIPVIVINNDVYTIGFSTDTVTIVEEGDTETVSLNIDPAPAMPTTVTLTVTKDGAPDLGSLSFNKDEFVFTSKKLASTATVAANKTGRYTVGIVLDEALSEDQALYGVSDTLMVEVTDPASIRIRIKVYLEGALP